MASPDSIHELYNQQLEADKPFVDDCIDAIKTQINQVIADEGETNFQFDMEPFITNQSENQQNRIKEKVIYHFRMIGVRAYMRYGVGSSHVVTIEWLPPFNTREFMKAYV